MLVGGVETVLGGTTTVVVVVVMIGASVVIVEVVVVVVVVEVEVCGSTAVVGGALAVPAAGSETDPDPF